MPPPDSPTTSPTLLGLLGDGNDAAWRTFLTRYAPVIDGWCRHAGLQPADADEVRSQVLHGLVTAMRGFRYDPARRFRGYLRAAVNNAIRRAAGDRRRKPGNYGTGGPGADELPGRPAPDTLADALDDRLSDDLLALHRAVERVRAGVSADVWLAYQLTAVDGRSAADAARALGKTVAAVYMAKSRVGRLLREAAPVPAGGDPPPAPE